jgi:3-methyl-2-oxobutanoate hydroxymethyltransferase
MKNSKNSPVTIHTLLQMKQANEKIACMTAYDYSFASLLDRNGMDLIMIGDSLGMVIQGNEHTLPVTLNEMIYHSRCVAKGCKRAIVVTDLPFMSYQTSPEQALKSAGKLMKQGGAHMVKLEGGAVMVETVRFLVERGVPVCAHIGLTPQSVHQLGGYKVQGKDKAAADVLADDALALQDAGAGAIVLEAVPATLAKRVSESLTIPTIGIGAGVDCDGQVLVLQDALGLYPDHSPRFAKNFLAGSDSIDAAIADYVGQVKAKKFPAPEHSF